MSAVSVSVHGANELGRLQRDLKAAGRKDLRRELSRGIQKAAKPLRAVPAVAALASLPKDGGLAERVAGSKFSVRTRAGRNPGVRVVGAGDLDLRSLNRGRLRHPLFGHRHYWYTQLVPPHWFDDALEKAADGPVRQEILNAIGRVAGKLGGGA